MVTLKDDISVVENLTVLAFGSLDQSHRTISGLIGQMMSAGYSQDEIIAVFRKAGLPAEVIDDPEFAVSAAYELSLLANVISRLEQNRQNILRHTIGVGSELGINQLGFFGLTLQHAPTVLEVVQEILRCPELVWGHSRVLMTRVKNRVRLTFEMATSPSDLAPSTLAKLSEYCVVRDTISMAKILYRVSGNKAHPVMARLACDAPSGRYNAGARFGCPVYFESDAYALEYEYEAMLIAPVHADEFTFKRYKRMLVRFVEGLADDKTVSDRVRDILWAYSPVPDRVEVAGMLGMGDRTLARRLAREGTSFNQLLALVNVERARNFLGHSTKSIAEVAYSMGYSDPAAFTRAFKSWTGVTPSKWREQEEHIA